MSAEVMSIAVCEVVGKLKAKGVYLAKIYFTVCASVQAMLDDGAAYAHCIAVKARCV